MERLIRGLADIALDHLDKNKDNRDSEEQTQSEDRDERSRSSWAQVVSGEQQEDGNESSVNDRRHGYDRQQWNTEEENYGRNEGWKTGGSRPSMRPQKATHEEFKKNEERRPDYYGLGHQNPGEEENKDGWQTVSKKPQKQPHKVQVDNWHNYKRPPTEQDYSNDVEYGENMEPSEKELADLSNACNKLWELDLNRLVPGKDYQIDIGEGKKAFEREDMAEGGLFSYVSDNVLQKPTYSRFCSLLDNYNPHQGYKEVVTSEEKQEQEAFIEEISRTAPIKYLFKYLLLKRIISGDYQDFKRILSSLWFDLYGRGGTSRSSSAFEHVFVGEIKQQNEVSGFHNWLQFYLEEAKGRVDYQGYIIPRRRGHIPDSETQLLTIQFEWNGVLKSVSSTLIGVSPEFEIALYTLCFYVGDENNYVDLGPYPVNIKCYRLGNKIGSVFPIAEG